MALFSNEHIIIEQADRQLGGFFLPIIINSEKSLKIIGAVFNKRYPTAKLEKGDRVIARSDACKYHALPITDFEDALLELAPEFVPVLFQIKLGQTHLAA